MFGHTAQHYSLLNDNKCGFYQAQLWLVIPADLVLLLGGGVAGIQGLSGWSVECEQTNKQHVTYSFKALLCLCGHHWSDF